MFQMFKGKMTELAAPMTGTCIPIAECKDPVFKEKMVGDGVAIIPKEDTVYAPCDGTVAHVAHTYHAVGFRRDDGVEIILHIGIDTVTLEGEGFTCFIETGQKVKAGDKLMEIDRAFIESKGLSLESPFIISNMPEVKKLEIKTGEVTHGEDIVIRYSLK